MKKAYCKPAALVVKIQAVSMMATSETSNYTREDYTSGGYNTWWGKEGNVEDDDSE